MTAGSMLLDELAARQDESPRRAQHHPMDSSWVLLGLLEIARRAATEEDLTDDSLRGVISRGVMRSLMAALQFRDGRTVQHCRRVAMIATAVARHLGWDGRHLSVLEVAALVHDIGKIGVPDNILLKPGKLSPDESELMALHYNIGIDMLQACRVDPDVIDIVSQAHLHSGADGARPNLGARILAVSDAYDAIITPQVYREGKTHAEAMTILQDSGGRQFDANVIAALARCVDRNGSPLDQMDDPFAPQKGFGPSFSRPEEALEASQLGHMFSYLYLLEHLYDGFYLVDSDLRVLIWNRNAENLLGHPSQKMLGKQWSRRMLNYADRFGEALPDAEVPMNRVVTTGLPQSPALKMQRADGEWLDVEVQTVPLVDPAGRLQGVIEILRDLSRSSCRNMQFQEMRSAASRDALTGVANRGELETRLTNVVKEASGHPNRETFSVIFLDVDHFKRINDTWGHAAGDQVLVDVARLMQSETYSGELVGRYGGEEFVIICPGTSLPDAIKRAERLRQALPKASVGGIKELTVTASFGVSQFETGDSVESVLRRADKALYQAKGTGRNKTCALTSQDLLKLESQKAEQAEHPSDPFLYETTFYACIAADMVVYKLGGFVTEHKAALVDVKPHRVVLRLGSRGFLPFWGSTDERRPVEIELQFGANSPSTPKRMAQVAVTAKVRPLGWIRDRETFGNRAKRAVKQLRSYFAAE